MIIKGTIKLGEQVLLANILVSVKLSISPQTGIRSWGGFFLASADTNLEADGPYKLILEDGRSSDILISNAAHQNNLIRVQFENAGNFG